jgi:hypothetical protein
LEETMNSIMSSFGPQPQPVGLASCHTAWVPHGAARCNARPSITAPNAAGATRPVEARRWSLSDTVGGKSSREIRALRLERR